MHRSVDHIPYPPRRYPFFYGWVVAVLGAIGFLMSTPGQTYGVAPFTDPLMAAMGMSRVQLSTAYMLGTIISGFCLTPAGRLYDRYGARVVAPLASLGLGLVLVAFSQADRIAGALAEYLPPAAAPYVYFTLVFLLFFAVRLTGQGVLTMVSRNMVMKWFDRHRGLITGVTGMVVAPSFSAMPALLNELVEGVGWRSAWLWMALVVGGIFSVVAGLLYRDNPEACGLKPDGPLADRALGSRRPRGGAARQFTLAEARRTYSLWIFMLGTALFGLHVTAMSFHAASIFATAGMPPASGYLIFLYAALLSLLLRPLVGWVADRAPLKYLLITMLAGVAVSGVGVALLAPGPWRWIVVGGNGVASATVGTLMTITWPNFYGRKHLGAISGFSMAGMVFASAVGPWIYSQSRNLTYHYAGASLLVTSVAIMLAVLALHADNPQPEAPREGAQG